MNEERATPGGELEQGAGVGSAWWPAEHEVDRFGLSLKERNRDLTGRKRLTDVSHQEIDNRSPPQSAGHFLAEGGQSPDQVKIGAGALGS
jgi:hypothetical protein